jgi:acyl carrier protein
VDEDARAQIEGRIASVLSAVLSRPIALGGPALFSDDPDWDSLRHVELVFALEDAFRIRFDENEIPTLLSLETIAASVIRHMA